MNTRRIPCTDLRPGHVVETSHGWRTVTSAGTFPGGPAVYGLMWRWCWKPGTPGKHSRIDCGYSGHVLASASEFFVTIQQSEPA